jgi:hypothetical protein
MYKSHLKKKWNKKHIIEMESSRENFSLFLLNYKLVGPFITTEFANLNLNKNYL